MTKMEHPLYWTWRAMRRRCRPQYTESEYYEERGIKLCPEWENFWTFVSDMGPKPTPSHSIDRIDNDGNYEPSNCRWADDSQQQKNTRQVQLLTFNGETKAKKEWARHLGMSWGGFYRRVRVFGYEAAVRMGPKC